MINVLNKDGEIEKFKPSRIKNKIISETGLDEDEAEKIKISVVSTIHKNYDDEVDTNTIRSLINAQLVKRGLIREESKSRKLGMSVSDFEALIENGCHDNANIGYCLSENNNVLIKDANNNISIVKICEIPKLIQKRDYYVPSINMDTNEISWKKIINAGKTGHKPVYLVKFGKGHSIELTDNHNLLRVTNDVNGYRIAKIRQKISLKECIEENTFRHIAKINSIPNFDKEDNYYESALFGFFLGDGTVANDNGLVRFGFKKQDKIDYLIDLCEKLNLKYTKNEWNNGVTGINIHNLYPNMPKSDLIKKYNDINTLGLLEGLINSDGSITLHRNNLLLKYTSANEDIINLMYVCLLMNGVPANCLFGKKYHTLNIKSKNLDRLLSKLNLREDFQEKYNKAHHNTTRDYDKLSEMVISEYVFQGEKDVYNLTIADNHNYLAGIHGLIPVSNSPEMVAKYAYDSIAKEYALLSMPEDCAKAHKNCYVHHHDMEYYNTRSNCFNYNLSFFAKNGLKIDGRGDIGSVAKPAKSLEVLLNHLLQVFMAGASVLSGGQGLVNFNTLLAPFCKGRTYEEIKQAIQGFIFNCNMSLIARGGQICFTSISLDMSVPDVLKDEPAITYGGIEQGTYKDYQEEADLIFRAVLEVSSEKDGQGAYHRFPNILINIREHDLDEYTGNCKLLHELGANNPTLYYTNCTGVEKTIMGCVEGNEKVYCSINGDERYYTFKELDKIIGADYGATNIKDIDIKYLSINGDGDYEMIKPKNFIKNHNVKIYCVSLGDNTKFYCDACHTVIDANTGLKVNIFYAYNSKRPILTCDRYLENYTTTITNIEYTNRHDDTYCFEGNGKIVIGEDYILTGNCRTSNLMNYRENYEEDCMNTGNFMYTTLNLELMALESESEEDFYNKLDYYCEIVYKTLHDRRSKIEDILYNKHMSDFLLQKDKDTGEPLYDLDRLSYTIGFAGLNETLEVLYGKSIVEDIIDGERILEFINEKAKQFHDRDGWRWGVIGSPAESTAYRFGEYNRKKYPECPIQGAEGSYYVTNSHHIPVSANVNIDEHIRNAEVFHKLCGGGCLLHIWSGEVYSDPKSIWSLNKKILAHNVQFWAYSKVFTYCRECGFTINEEVEECPICKSKDLRVYDRVTGYYLPRDTFNKGKLQEQKERYRLSI